MNDNQYKVAKHFGDEKKAIYWNLPLRPYTVKSTRTRLISEVKPLMALSVLR
ncbi:663_t:CDS:2, partial [Ambispora gerdemannii]